MVTDYQLLRAVQSLAYRRRLLDGIKDLEGTVREYLSEHQTGRVRIGGYDIQAEKGQVRVEELPFGDVDQLYLPLYAAHDHETDKSETQNPG
ncbi:MAG: hypothetical protein IIA59_06830 [Candidatus Marinimicrobia bacterium]|nr:hypothetical protein [Candidatus Neomarinimicrobiota bacterium]